MGDSNDLYVAPGETAAMQVAASCEVGEVHYQWSEFDVDEMSFVDIANATASSYTTPALTQSAKYLCRVWDDFGTATSMVFNAITFSTLTLGATATATAQGGAIVGFAFVPAETGRYVFYSSADHDTYGYLYDSDGIEIQSDDDGSGNGNFAVHCDLEAGVQYYFGARLYNDEEAGSFDVCLELEDN